MSANENTTATSQVNHAGDSTTLIPRHSTGVGSDDWFGDPFIYEHFLVKVCGESRTLYELARGGGSTLRGVEPIGMGVWIDVDRTPESLRKALWDVIKEALKKKDVS